MTVRTVREPVYLYECDTCGAGVHGYTLPHGWKAGNLFGSFRQHIHMCRGCLDRMVELLPLIKPFIDEEAP